MAAAFQEALGPGVKVYSQANLVAESLADYLTRRPEFLGPGQQSKFLTTGDAKSVSSKATQFLRRQITFEKA
jgi:glutamate racemase